MEVEKKHKLQRLFHSNPTKYAFEYHNVRNTVTNTIKRAKDDCYENKLQDNTYNRKGLCQL